MLPVHSKHSIFLFKSRETYCLYNSAISAFKTQRLFLFKSSRETYYLYNSATSAFKAQRIFLFKSSREPFCLYNLIADYYKDILYIWFILTFHEGVNIVNYPVMQLRFQKTKYPSLVLVRYTHLYSNFPICTHVHTHYVSLWYKIYSNSSS